MLKEVAIKRKFGDLALPKYIANNLHFYTKKTVLFHTRADSITFPVSRELQKTKLKAQ